MYAKWSKDPLLLARLTAAVKTSYSWAGALTQLGLVASGAAYKGIKLACRRLNLDTSHFTGQGHLRGKTHTWNKKLPLEEVLVQNSPYTSSSNLKKRLLKEGVLDERCTGEGCEQGPIWNRKPLVLQLDHINGINTDHRRENLRLLCPNCHSQTETFCGKNQGH